MSNDLIEDIIITRESLGVTRQQFSTILILGNKKDNDETIKEYKSLREVLVDFPADPQGNHTEEYKCASKIFLQQPSVSKVFIAQKKSAETWVGLHERFVSSGKYAYCVIVANTIAGQVLDITDDELKALAIATEANKQVFAVNIVTGKEIVLGKFFKDQNYKRVVTFFKDANNDYPNAAIMGSILARDAGTYTLSFLDVSGIQPANLNNTRKLELENNNINYYDYVSNETNARVSASCGKVVNGKAFEISYFEDWVITTIKENILNVFLSKPIVSYDAFGFSLVSGAIMQALIEAANRKIIQPVSNNDVTMPDLNRISEQDRAAGILNGITFKFTLSYAIKKIGTIVGIVTALNS